MLEDDEEEDDEEEEAAAPEPAAAGALAGLAGAPEASFAAGVTDALESFLVDP